MKILLFLISLSSFACNLSQLNKQQEVMKALISKYQQDEKSPLESIRRMDFYGTGRVRLVYLAKGLETKNINTNFSLDKKCKVSFADLKF